MTREICKCCGEVNRVGFSVPPEVWRDSVPLFWSTCVLCLNCFTRFADEAQVEWDRQIEFWPVSFVRHCRDLER